MTDLKKMPFWKSLLLFGIPSLYFLIITKYGIPFLARHAIHPALSWFIAGYCIFVPLALGAVLLVKREEKNIDLASLWKRLRINKPTKTDWYWAFGATALILILTGLIMVLTNFLALRFGFHELQTTPPFMRFKVLQGYERLYLLVWLGMFFFNIMGEGMLWQGYILPRQELTHSKQAWFVNALLWMMFHLCFGIDLLILLTPTLLIIPYCTQKTKNTLVGMIPHALLNGPMFIIIALGILR